LLPPSSSNAPDPLRRPCRFDAAHARSLNLARPWWYADAMSLVWRPRALAHLDGHQCTLLSPPAPPAPSTPPCRCFGKQSPTQPPFASDRRVSGVADRRLRYARGGRRVGDYRVTELRSIIPCSACHIAWASLSSFESGQGESTGLYICPRCGHLENRVLAIATT